MPPLITGEPHGKAFWRSLDDLADTPGFRRFVEKEFPAYADEMLAPRSRRGFLKLMGASMALAGMTACRWPEEEILPFTRRPEGYLPGEPSQFATAMELGGVATGLLVKSYDGRPVKIEGNPLHPQSRGATSAIEQAALLELYDPDRSQHPARRVEAGHRPAEWEEFATEAVPLFAARRAGGHGLRILSESSSSPTVRRIRDDLLRRAREPRIRML